MTGRFSSAGTFPPDAADNQSPIIRLDNQGVPDQTFSPVIKQAGDVVATLVQPDGRIVIGGEFTNVNGTTAYRLARLNADGTLDAAFDAGFVATVSVTSLALQTDGKVLFTASDVNTPNSTAPNIVARLNTDGGVDLGFAAAAPTGGLITASVLQPDGKLVIAGSFQDPTGVTPNGIERLNADGGLDTTFNPDTGAATNISALALQSNGQILAGGQYVSGNGKTTRSLARLNPDGSFDPAFTNLVPALFPGINVILTQPDDKILLGGSFTSSPGQNFSGVARLNADGTADTNFNTGAGFATDPNGDPSLVFALALQKDGKILAGGAFNSVNGQSFNGLVRLLPDGGVDATFSAGAGADQQVSSLALQADNRIIVGGAFTSLDGTPNEGLARLNNDLPTAQGTLSFTAPTYQANENAGTATISVQRTGGNTGVVTIDYTTMDGTAVSGVNYQSASGTLTWPDGDSTPKVISVVVLDDGVITPDLTVQLTLGRPTNGVVLGSPNTATLTITNTDTGVTPPPPTPTPTPTPVPTPVPTGVAVTITSPPDGIKLVAGAPLSLAASVLDPSQALTRVQFFLNGQPFLQFPVTGPFIAQTTTPPAGTYTLELDAVDNTGDHGHRHAHPQRDRARRG